MEAFEWFYFKHCGDSSSSSHRDLEATLAECPASSLAADVNKPLNMESQKPVPELGFWDSTLPVCFAQVPVLF